jgi:GNAT superfamily N-acetyltransferase
MVDGGVHEIHFGLLRLEEAEALVELAGHIWRLHYPGIISSEQIEYMLARRYKPGLVRQLLARGDLWLAARDGDELVGFAHVHPLAEGDYKLDKLYVHPDYQRHGIGACLVDEVVRHVLERGCHRLALRVNRHNHAAIRAYLKFGFQVADVMLEDIGHGFYMDDYVMVKLLDADSSINETRPA